MYAQTGLFKESKNDTKIFTAPFLFAPNNAAKKSMKSSRPM